MPIASSPHQGFPTGDTAADTPAAADTARRVALRRFWTIAEAGCGGGKDEQGNPYSMRVFRENCGRKRGSRSQQRANQLSGLDDL